MKYLILFLALIPAMVMGTYLLYGSGFIWFDDIVQWAEHAFSLYLPVASDKLYFLSKFSALSALWLLIFAFLVQPLRTYVRFDLVEFKKLLGGFAVGYATLHALFFLWAQHFALSHVTTLFGHHLFLTMGLGALLILSIAPHIKAWYKLLYIGVVLVIVHLLLGYHSLSDVHIWAISLLSLGLALRLVKR